jgi:hypothetical protein
VTAQQPIDRIVDHVVVLTSPGEMVEISERLQSAGFRLADEVVAETLGVSSHLLPIAGGGFIELSSETSPGSSPNPGRFEVTPRISALSYTTMDAAADLARLTTRSDAEGTMAACGSWTRKSNGTRGYYTGVVPGGFRTDFAFTVQLQERRLFPLPYLDDAETAPPIRRITVTGPDAATWQQRHREWLLLPTRDGAMRAGGTELTFEQRDAGDTTLTVTFAVSNVDIDIPLARDAFEFIPAS